MRIILANLLLAITTCATSAGDDKDSCKGKNCTHILLQTIMYEYPNYSLS